MHTHTTRYQQPCRGVWRRHAFHFLLYAVWRHDVCAARNTHTCIYKPRARRVGGHGIMVWRHRMAWLACAYGVARTRRVAYGALLLHARAVRTHRHLLLPFPAAAAHACAAGTWRRAVIVALPYFSPFCARARCCQRMRFALLAAVRGWRWRGALLVARMLARRHTGVAGHGGFLPFSHALPPPTMSARAYARLLPCALPYMTQRITSAHMPCAPPQRQSRTHARPFRICLQRRMARGAGAGVRSLALPFALHGAPSALYRGSLAARLARAVP